MSCDVVLGILLNKTSTNCRTCGATASEILSSFKKDSFPFWMPCDVLGTAVNYAEDLFLG